MPWISPSRPTDLCQREGRRWRVARPMVDSRRRSTSAYAALRLLCFRRFLVLEVILYIPILFFIAHTCNLLTYLVAELAHQANGIDLNLSLHRGVPPSGFLFREEDSHDVDLWSCSRECVPD